MQNFCINLLPDIFYMDFEQLKKQIEHYRSRDLKLFVTSSFQTHSIPLLHQLSRIEKSIPVYFLNTGFLFPETLEYRDLICKQYNLNLKTIYSQTPKAQQLDSRGRFLFTSNPDYCCYLNKIQPMEPLLAKYDIWINGVRADQNDNRSEFKIEEKTPSGALRFHPMLDWSKSMIEDYIKEYRIPRHPLEAEGYMSIGCEPCTRKMDLEIEADPRLSRWFGMNKTECGLHTELISKS